MMNVLQNNTVVVLGGSGVVANYIQIVLARNGFAGTIAARKPPKLLEEFRWVPTQDLVSGEWQIPPECTVISLWKLGLFVEHLGKMKSANQIVALSSTSVFTKADSSEPSAKNLASYLNRSEAELREALKDTGIPFTILRPTVIYDGKTDNSIRDIASVIKRFGFFPIAGKGEGKRQPIHAEDVCEMIYRCIGCEQAHNTSFNIVGGSTITYRAMIEQIFLGMRKKPRILSIPRAPLKFIAFVAKRLKIINHDPGVVDRMDHDFVFDGRAANEVLNYRPRTFNPSISI